MTDLRIRNHGTVVTLEPVSERGRSWMDDNLVTEPWQWLGSTLGIEHRLAPSVVQSAICDGLEVTGD